MQTRLGEREWVRRFASGFPFVFSERKKFRHWNPQADRFRRVVNESSVRFINYVDTVDMSGALHLPVYIGFYVARFSE